MSHRQVSVFSVMDLGDKKRRIYSVAECLRRHLRGIPIPEIILTNLLEPRCIRGQSLWPRGLRHELSLLARTLGDRGFKSYSSHGCLCAFTLCLFCSVCR
jgi:hypothetical protein